MAQVTVHIGYYGSGKTEISLNTALRYAEESDVTLIDLDIVNPYFRSGERRELLENNGIRVITPNFLGTNIDVPSLPPAIETALLDPSRRVVVDVGGDHPGAVVLGRYQKTLSQLETEIICIININRPYTGTCEEIVEMVHSLEEKSRLKITSLANNTNMARETTAQMVMEGQRVIEQAGELLRIPVNYLFAMEPVWEKLPEEFRRHYSEIYRRIDLYMRPLWFDQR